MRAGAPAVGRRGDARPRENDRACDQTDGTWGVPRAQRKFARAHTPRSRRSRHTRPHAVSSLHVVLHHVLALPRRAVRAGCQDRFLEDEAIAKPTAETISARHPEAALSRHGHGSGIEQREARRASDLRLFDRTIATDTHLHVDRPLPALSSGACRVVGDWTATTRPAQVARPASARSRSITARTSASGACSGRGCLRLPIDFGAAGSRRGLRVVRRAGR